MADRPDVVDLKAMLNAPVGAEMNRAEAAFARTLIVKQAAGIVHHWAFQPITFKLAFDLRYTPDFMVLYTTGIMEFVEVKGFEREDARDKFKQAATQHPWCRWRMVRRVKSTDEFNTIREFYRGGEEL